MKHVNKKRVTRLIVLASVVALLLGVIGGTLAYMAAKTEPVQNQFTFGDLPIDIPETIDKGVKSNVKIHNGGNVDAYVRAKIVVTWKNAAGEVSGVIPKESTDYTMELNKTNWFEGKDGFWYCSLPVKAGPNSFSPVLITKATRTKEANIPEGYNLSVEILAQSVQADGVKDGRPMVENLWPVTVDTSGTLVPTA